MLFPFANGFSVDDAFEEAANNQCPHICDVKLQVSGAALPKGLGVAVFAADGAPNPVAATACEGAPNLPVAIGFAGVPKTPLEGWPNGEVVLDEEVAKALFGIGVVVAKGLNFAGPDEGGGKEAAAVFVAAKGLCEGSVLEAEEKEFVANGFEGISVCVGTSTLIGDSAINCTSFEGSTDPDLPKPPRPL